MSPALALQCLQTWWLVSLSTGVSMHRARKMSRPGIYYPGGGVVEGLTLSPSHFPRSRPFLLGFSCVVYGVQPHKDATSATWWLQGMHFQLVPILCSSEIWDESWLFSSLEFEGRGDLSVINYIGWAWKQCCLAPNIYILHANPLDGQIHLTLSYAHILRHFHLSLIRQLLSSPFIKMYSVWHSCLKEQITFSVELAFI